MEPQESREIQQAWDGIAHGYDRNVTPTHFWLGSQGLSRAGLCAGMRFLDVAAGTLERLGLTDFAARPVQTLSGGEQQRVALARALAQQTPVLLLDEPTSALDIGHRQQVLELGDQLRHEGELMVLAAMHDLTLAAQYADRLVLLDHGRVAAAGAPQQVLTRERIAAHFDADVHVVDAPDGSLALLPARSRAARRA